MRGFVVQDLPGGAYFAFNNYVNAGATLTRATATQMQSKRDRMGCALCGSSYALFAGGWSGGWSNHVDAYTPALVRSIATPLTTGKYELAGASTASYALFAGGVISGGVHQSEMDYYNTSLTKSVGTALSEARSELRGLNFNGNALFVGGYTGGRSVVVDYYNDSLTRSTVSLATGRSKPGLALAGSYALVAGGYTSGGMTTSVEYFNTSMVRTTLGTGLAVAGEPVGTNIGATHAIFAGGRSSPGGESVSAFDTSLTRTVCTSLKTPTSVMFAGPLSTGAIFAGGNIAADPYRSPLVYHYDSALSQSMGPSLESARGSGAATTIGNYLLLAGGSTDTVNETVEAFSVGSTFKISVFGVGTKHKLNAGSESTTTQPVTEVTVTPPVTGYIQMT